MINTLKTFTLNYKDELSDDLVFWLSFLLYFGNGAFRPMWGFLYDKIGFKKLMTLIFSLIIVISISFYFIILIKPLLFICCIIVSALAGAPFVILPAAMTEVYGVKYSSEIYGTTFYCFGIAGFICPILSKSLDLAHSSTTIPYLVIYTVGGGFGIVGLILSITISMKPYVYSYY